MATTRTKRKKTTRARKSRRKVRVAFIGAGGRAVGSHYTSIRDIAGAEICAIAELDEGRMRKAAADFGVRALYTDYKQMIEREKPDVVYAIMPPQHLFGVAATVMDMGTRNIAPGDNESDTEAMNVRIAISACATWEKEDTGLEWTDRVEFIKNALRGRLLGYGVMSIAFVRDDPIDVIFTAGAIEGLWLIDVAVEFFKEVDEFDDWS